MRSKYFRGGPNILKYLDQGGPYISGVQIFHDSPTGPLVSLLLRITDVQARPVVVSFPDPPPKRKGGSGEYSTTSHYGLAVAMDSAKSQAFEVSCWASVNWKVC